MSDGLIKMYSEFHGQEHGNPLLCIHGFGASLYSWRNFVAAGSPLTANYRVITIDLKGAGKSPKVYGNDYSTQTHADLIYEFIHEHDLKNLTLIGNSFGGALALLVTLMLTDHDPTRLNSLVLIDAGSYVDLLPAYLKILSWPVIGALAAYLAPSKLAACGVLRKSYYDSKKITKEQIASYAAPLSLPGARHALLQTGAQIIPPNFPALAARYKDIKVPTLIIWGENDKVIDPEAARRLKKAIPHSEPLVWVPECGHVPQEERPEKTIPPIVTFLQTVYSAGGQANASAATTQP
jgi:pimeloyl-ACP methyl ester carboxylesterase